jgi:hypothetical protein
LPRFADRWTLAAALDGPGHAHRGRRRGLCTADKEGTQHPPYLRGVADDPGLRLVELHASHVAHVMAPDTVAGPLLDLVAAGT